MKLKDVLIEQGMTIRELSEKTGIELEMLKAFAEGKDVVTVKQTGQIMDVLGMKQEDMFGILTDILVEGLVQLKKAREEEKERIDNMKLKKALEEKGMTLVELSEKTGIEMEVLEVFVKSERGLLLEQAEQVGKVLGMDWWDVLGV